MKKRNRKNLYYRKKRYLMYSFLFLLLFITMGYSVLNAELGIHGDVELKEYYAPTLYNVLKKEAKTGALAKEYTGSHHDSFTEEPSQKIYHWYAENNTDGTSIQDKNNVIFANHCWQMVRTTDTGGVKMIYNGEAENNQCLNTRGNHVGYAKETTQSMSTTYYYGTDYTYDKTNNVFSLSGTTSTGEIKVGEYTCKSTTADGTCATLYLVDTLSSGTTYNVIPLNGNSHYSQFGTLQYSQNNYSLADVGYMYNTRYLNIPIAMEHIETMYRNQTFSLNNWYADSVTWGSPNANVYNLDNPYQVTTTEDYPNLVGKYTFQNATQTYTSTNVRYIVAVNNTTFYYIQLSNESGSTHDLSYYNYTYTYGDSYTDNGNGTYTINNPTTINRSDWYTSYNNVGAGKYVCKNAVNNTCSDLWYTIATSNNDMKFLEIADNYKYSKGFSWDGSKYVLDNDTSTSFWNINDSANKTSLNNAHYTCWNETGKCTTISYIYYISGTTLYYINIKNGKSVEDAINEMLYNDDVNTSNSTIKTGVDAWYKKYLLDYSEKLEDTIFCNDRSQSNSSTNGWNPNGGNISKYMYFYASGDLSCPNETDKFSVSNNKAKLTYKAGLMSRPEMNLLGNTNVKKTGQYYWLGSPREFFLGDYASIYNVSVSGDFGYNYITSISGLRPSISLTPGTEYTSGDGSMANPYVVDTN